MRKIALLKEEKRVAQVTRTTLLDDVTNTKIQNNIVAHDYGLVHL